jgi:hypothetical protein
MAVSIDAGVGRAAITFGTYLVKTCVGTSGRCVDQASRNAPSADSEGP